MDAKKNLADSPSVSPDLKRQAPEDPPTIFPEEIKQGLLEMDISKKLCLLLIPFSLVLIAILAALNITTVYEVPLVLPVMNTLFIGVISIGIAYITTRVYTRSGTASVFLIGSGILMFGLGAITAGWLILLPGGPNINVTIDNTCTFIGSLFILTGAAISCLTPIHGTGRGSTWKGTAIYTGILVFVALFCMATVKGWVPPFFIPGIGFTVHRQVLLDNAIVFYAISSVLFLYTYLEERTDFFFWYSVSFALLSIGLFAFFVQPTVGSLMGWVGRSANYLGFVFALYAVYIAQRAATAKDLPLEEIIANFFVDAEQSYKQLVETATDAIVTYDEDYRILLWNAAAERMFGYRRDEVIGLSFPELAIDERYIAVIKNEEGDFPADRTQPRVPVSVEIVSKRKDGTLIPVELTISRRFQEGRLIRTCILRDLTERKRAEEALYMSLVMDGVPTQLSYVDADLHFVYVNKAYAEWYGKTIKDLKGKSIRDVTGEEEFLQALPHYKMVLSGKPVSFENITHDTEGKEHFEIVTLVPHYKGEQVTGFFASIIDITERKRAQDTIALTTRKLSLMNDVTYQYIQNKVTAVRGYAVISKDAKTEAERLSFIETEEHILADIHHLIKNTREYQEIGLLLPRWIPVEQSIRIAVSLISPNQDISIKTTLHGLELYSDPLLEKIFANLIENAVLHGKTTRHITFSCEETQKGLILICEDNGVGISPKDKAHLFDRLVGENIRFGLFFVRECLLLSGMTIAETGKPGMGARFEITVPKGAWRMVEADKTGN